MNKSLSAWMVVVLGTIIPLVVSYFRFFLGEGLDIKVTLQYSSQYVVLLLVLLSTTSNSNTK